jgi:hypothetical protein
VPSLPDADTDDLSAAVLTYLRRRQQLVVRLRRVERALADVQQAEADGWTAERPSGLGREALMGLLVMLRQELAWLDSHRAATTR